MGYWGEPTASVDWCEPNYIWTTYIAEFFNTLSSIPIFLSAAYGIYLTLAHNYHLHLILPYTFMAIVGLGSMAFHGTLLKAGQAADEVPMLWAATSLLFCAMDTDMRKRRPILAAGLTLFCLATTVCYFLLKDYFIYFLGSYIALVLGLFGALLKLVPRVKDPAARNLLYSSAVFYLFGFFFLWIPDKLLCDYVRPYSFHAWFHLTSCVGPFLIITFATYCQHLISDKHKPRLIYHFNGFVPVVKRAENASPSGTRSSPR